MITNQFVDFNSSYNVRIDEGNKGKKSSENNDDSIENKKMLNAIENSLGIIESNKTPRQFLKSLIDASTILNQSNVRESGSNIEDDISEQIWDGLDIYSQILEQMYADTEPGVGRFTEGLVMMFEQIKEGGLNKEEYEDLFQLILLDAMANSEQYGLSSWYQTNKNDISHMLESLGSGSHSLHEANYNSPEKMAAIAKKLFDSLKKNGNIPTDSFLGQMISLLDNSGGGNALSDQIISGWDSAYGNSNWLTGENTTISPTLRLFVATTLKGLMNITDEEFNMILTGTLAQIDEIVKNKMGVNTITFLTENTSWRYIASNGIDWYGNGIEIDELEGLYVNFPGRNFTEEEMEEINRIGDIVKILMQILKQWHKLNTDNGVSISRNI